MKTPPQDQDKRDRFATEIDKNFSVVAAAGAGKTTAITKRIVEIAIKRPEWLPRLIVVTFTNRAADEMQQRAREEIFQAFAGRNSELEVDENRGLSLEVLTTFNRTFFGTIHSFCTKLLATHGHHLGLPSRLDLISNDEELWNEFVQRTDSVGNTLSPENRNALFRHVQVRDLMELGRRGKLPLAIEQDEMSCPKIVDLSPLRNYPARAGATRIEALQKLLAEWEEGFNNGTDFLPLVECTTGGRFQEVWEETFREFNQWLSCCALKVAAEVQAKYRQFRSERGTVTFDDQISLALKLTENREVISRIRAKDYIVILDEAQDTDPQQFSILTEITRPPQAAGRWIDNLQNPPQPGRFCMVGDFQQSIYGDRADLKQYQRVHEVLTTSGTGEELKFSVTFRLDQAQVDFVNKCFRDILNADGQVGFIELQPRPEKLLGQVVRLDITSDFLKQNPEASENEKARAEATQLANWLAQTEREKLRAHSWERVAILCPRRKWFRPLADALRNVGIKSQIQSETDVKGDSPAHAWFTALMTIMTQPRCGFEVVGVLREIFGISDHDLALFSDGYGDLFQIETPTGGTDSVATVVDLLAQVHREIVDKPLFTAVERIVDATQLRNRLTMLPAEDFENLEAELGVLLQSAATAEAEGGTLEEFAELLRANFATEREGTAPRAGVIQLITCQKAKGLEWDTVIVPFFSRRIHTGEEDFPRIITAPYDPQAMVAFSKGGVPAERKNALDQAHVQEMERLLYVALTRARHTLVLAADRELFAKADGSAPSASLTTWFRSDHGQQNEQHVLGLSAEPGIDIRTHELRSAQLEDEQQQIAELPKFVLTTAKSHAEEFARKISPSSFISGDGHINRTGADVWKETETEFRARSFPSEATRYGVWWHEFVQQVPWNADPAEWDKIFDAALHDSPVQERAASEWRTFRRRISKQSDFPSCFTNGAAVVHVEMPFLWRMDERRCLEGVVDLAVFESAAKQWFILDWKTNKIELDEIDKLHSHYRPQIAAYWKAIAEMTGSDVSAAIYSTANGKFLKYEPAELAAEWERLEKLSAAQLLAELAEA